MNIPNKLHFVWVGDESLCPHQYIETWRLYHPDYDIHIWGNKELQEYPWKNAAHIKMFVDKEIWAGVCDIMRWEILRDEGGITLDVDSICLSKIPDWMSYCTAWACWEQERVRPGLIGASAIGSIPNTLLLNALVERLYLQKNLLDKPAWMTVGPLHLSETWRKTLDNSLTILPSHFFYPEHLSGVNYTGSGLIIAQQLWLTSKGGYKKISSDSAI